MNILYQNDRFILLQILSVCLNFEPVIQSKRKGAGLTNLQITLFSRLVT
jgi:hypothetical protein